MVTHKFKLHRILDGKDEVIGVFKVENDQIKFPTHADEHHCSMFPAGPISNYTRNRISNLLDSKTKTMYLEKVK